MSNQLILINFAEACLIFCVDQKLTHFIRTFYWLGFNKHCRELKRKA